MVPRVCVECRSYDFNKVVVLRLISLSLRLAHADTGCCLRTFRVRNSVLRLIPNMAVNSLTGSPCWYRREVASAGRRRVHRFGGGQSACHPRLAGGGAALLAQFQFQLGSCHDASDGARRRPTLGPWRPVRAWSRGRGSPAGPGYVNAVHRHNVHDDEAAYLAHCVELFLCVHRDRRSGAGGVRRSQCRGVDLRAGGDTLRLARRAEEAEAEAAAAAAEAKAAAEA